MNPAPAPAPMSHSSPNIVYPTVYEQPMITHPFPCHPITFRDFTEAQHHHMYNIDTIFQQHRNLLLSLHDRSELVGRVHIGVMQTCTIKGIVVDLIIYDYSGRGKIYGEREDRILYSDIVADPEYLYATEEFSRYIIKGAVIPWHNLPSSISSLPLNIKIQTTLQYIPRLSVFKVFCPAIDSASLQLSLKMANRSSPVIQLQPYINKELSFAKRIKKYNGNQGARPRFLIIMDFEATCDFAPEPLITVDNSEIIEFPWVVLDTLSLDIVYEQRFYIRPSFLDGITNYCQNLTGITKDDCSSGMSLEEAIQEFDQFLQQHIFPFGEHNFRIVTDSVWDLQVQLRLEAQRKGIPLAWWYQEYFDLRQEFRHFYAWFPFVKRGPPLHIMLNGKF
jgi:inhibitor of KinA sporulation pathway (predicted exonuclease)